jgi:hypothetical protein
LKIIKKKNVRELNSNSEGNKPVSKLNTPSGGALKKQEANEKCSAHVSSRGGPRSQRDEEMELANRFGTTTLSELVSRCVNVSFRCVPSSQSSTNNTTPPKTQGDSKTASSCAVEAYLIFESLVIFCII